MTKSYLHTVQVIETLQTRHCQPCECDDSACATCSVFERIQALRQQLGSEAGEDVEVKPKYQDRRHLSFQERNQELTLRLVKQSMVLQQLRQENQELKKQLEEAQRELLTRSTPGTPVFS